MVRLTLGGPQIAGFESHAPDEHTRLIFPDPATGKLRLRTRNGLALDWPRPHPPSRVYTVRRHDPAVGELDLDHPPGVEVRWLHRSSLEAAVRALDIDSAQRIYVWMGGEAGALAGLRGWARDELGLAPADRSIVGYWKRGVSDFEEEDDDV
jgi:NADPH-dependent ferric siderophore reductase